MEQAVHKRDLELPGTVHDVSLTAGDVTKTATMQKCIPRDNKAGKPVQNIKTEDIKSKNGMVKATDPVSEEKQTIIPQLSRNGPLNEMLCADTEASLSPGPVANQTSLSPGPVGYYNDRGVSLAVSNSPCDQFTPSVSTGQVSVDNSAVIDDVKSVIDAPFINNHNNRPRELVLNVSCDTYRACRSHAYQESHDSIGLYTCHSCANGLPNGLHMGNGLYEQNGLDCVPHDVKTKLVLIYSLQRLSLI